MKNDYVVKKVKVEKSYYDEETKCIHVIYLIDGSECQAQLERDLFSCGKRSEEQIVDALKQIAFQLNGKFINVELPEDGLRNFIRLREEVRREL